MSSSSGCRGGDSNNRSLPSSSFSSTHSHVEPHRPGPLMSSLSSSTRIVDPVRSIIHPQLYRAVQKCRQKQDAGKKRQKDDVRKRSIRRYEVFLSFRGKDTRASFTSHLYASLRNAGINVFRDDDSLKWGNVISASLLQAIEESQIAVIVFSKNYAGSRWCLDELVKIMECFRTIGQLVLPIFYGVDPSDVRHQRGEFGKAFESLLSRIPNNKGGMFAKAVNFFRDSSRNDELPNQVLRWKEALGQAAGIAGSVVLNSRNESDAIKDIVEYVTCLLNKRDLFVANNPVGVEHRVRDMIQLLNISQSDDVLILGMWGMGGVGKTTIAKAIYNKIGRKFEARSFLANVREVWEKKDRQMSLQEQLLSNICMDMTPKIENIDKGKTILEDRLRYKSVLLVLDDVNSLDQLNALCGSRKWFGSGSRIIITTRDMHLLRGSRVDQLYPMKEMDESESIELFSWHAFKQVRPKEDFAEISINIVEYSGGLPLALEVLGTLLFGRPVKEWKCVLDKLKRIPNNQVQEKLKISYDGLNDFTQKDIFLDIACFFIGMDRNDVIHILNECELYPENGINVLVERSLVTVDDMNKLRMHDLLRDMGREIIREKSPIRLEEHSRLWFSKDVLDALSKRTGTKFVEGLALMLPSANTEHFSTKAFKKMTELRLLQLAGVKLDDDFEYLSRNLRWISWNRFQEPCIPTGFYLGNLVSIELENSNIEFLWKETQSLEKLKILNLSHSHYLTQTPNFSKLPNLEKLVLIDCPKLSEVSDTFGDHKNLVLINLEDCISLRSLPRSIYKLKYLKALILSGCSMIEKLEEELELMESLTSLIANDTGITRVPFSVGRLKNIGYISLCGYEGFSRDVVPSLIRSWMSPTNNLPSPFQISVAMSSRVPLDVLNSSSHELSSMSKYLPWLPRLWVKCDSEVDLSRGTERVLKALHATHSKESVQVLNIETSALIQSCSRAHISGSITSFRPLFVQIGVNCQVTETLKQNILQDKGDSHLSCLKFNNNGSYVKFEVPQVEGRILKTIMCTVYPSTPNSITSNDIKNVLLINYTKATILLYKGEALASFEDEELQSAISSIESGNKVEFIVVFEDNFIVKNTTIYLIYDGPIHKELGFIVVH